jgi:hypothetical protein
VAVSVERVNARRTSQDERFVSYPPVLEPARLCPGDDSGASEIGTSEVKAAPADEARAVRHSKRREALALELLGRGLCGGAKAKPQVERASNGTIEAGRCE